MFIVVLKGLRQLDTLSNYRVFFSLKLFPGITQLTIYINTDNTYIPTSAKG